jgi:hypothetical protein
MLRRRSASHWRLWHAAARSTDAAPGLSGAAPRITAAAMNGVACGQVGPAPACTSYSDHPRRKYQGGFAQPILNPPQTVTRTVAVILRVTRIVSWDQTMNRRQAVTMPGLRSSPSSTVCAPPSFGRVHTIYFYARGLPRERDIRRVAPFVPSEVSVYVR